MIFLSENGFQHKLKLCSEHHKRRYILLPIKNCDSKFTEFLFKKTGQPAWCANRCATVSVFEQFLLKYQISGCFKLVSLVSLVTIESSLFLPEREIIRKECQSTSLLHTLLR